MLALFILFVARYYEKRRRRLKGLKGEDELDGTAQVVEFDDLKGNNTSYIIVLPSLIST